MPTMRLVDLMDSAPFTRSTDPARLERERLEETRLDGPYAAIEARGGKPKTETCYAEQLSMHAWTHFFKTMPELDDDEYEYALWMVWDSINWLAVVPMYTDESGARVIDARPAEVRLAAK